MKSKVSTKVLRSPVAKRIAHAARGSSTKRDPVLRAFLDDGAIIVDSFAGGGGASSGVARAMRSFGLEKDPDIAINHDAEAIAMHRANHPDTKHYIEDVWQVDPVEACQGRPVALAWFSPTCTHFSKAKGTALDESSIKIRGLCWVAVRWAAAVRPRVICLENVEEFLKFGPLHRQHTNGCEGRAVCRTLCRIHKPIKEREGELFKAFVSRLEKLGYKVEWRLLRACDFGAPTTRRRLFLVARCDGQSIVWPEPTHGPGRKPYRTAAECIDWDLECPSIFTRSKPLADKTLARISRGIDKFVLSNAKPFIVPVAYGGDVRVNDIDEPLRTVCGNRGGHAIVAPVMFKAKTYGGGGNDAKSVYQPLGTITASKRGEHAIATPIVVRSDMHQSNSSCAYSAEEPLRTITSGGGHAIATPVMVRTAHGDVDARGKRRGQGAHSVETPIGTICAGGTDFAIAVPYLVHRSNGERPEVVKEDGTVVAGQAPRIYDIEKPLGTIVAQGQKHAVTCAFLVKNNGGHNDACGASGQAVERPLDTIASRDQKSLALAHLLKMRGTSEAHIDASAHSMDQPVPTVSANGTHLAQVAAYLVRYNGTGDAEAVENPMPTQTTKPRFGLVEVTLASAVCERALRVAEFLGYDKPIVISLGGEQWVLVDIGMRMLAPRELYRAQGFDPEYVIDCPGPNGKPLTKTAQIRMVGNSVPPVMAEVLARAQIAA